MAALAADHGPSAADAGSGAAEPRFAFSRPLRFSTSAPQARTAAASRVARRPSRTTNAKVSTAAALTTTIDSGVIAERPRPSSDSTGDPVSPSAGVSSQATR
nr:hypothetical protein GCM10020092_098460 [Actinoplanes digitatis]